MNNHEFWSRRNFVRETRLSEQPVMVVFGAAWSGNCHISDRVVCKVVAEFERPIRLLRINVETDPEIADFYRVTTLPTVLFFVHGEVVDHIEGLAPESEIRNRLRYILPDGIENATE